MSPHANNTTEVTPLITVDDLSVMRPFLQRLACRTVPANLRQRVAPSDIVQQTYLEACRDFQRFRGASKQELRAWLRIILLNNTRNAIARVNTAKRDINRERSIRDGSAPVGAEKTPSSIVSSHEQLLRLQQALLQLPPEYRAAIELRSLRQCTFAQVGEELGKTEEAARKTWFRAVKLLRDGLS